MSRALLTVAETAAATGLGSRIIRQEIANGTIPGRRFGRYIRIPAWWVEEQRKGPSAREAS